MNNPIELQAKIDPKAVKARIVAIYGKITPAVILLHKKLNRSPEMVRQALRGRQPGLLVRVEREVCRIEAREREKLEKSNKRAVA
jgi:hypothetical protein